MVGQPLEILVPGPHYLSTISHMAVGTPEFSAVWEEVQSLQDPLREGLGVVMVASREALGTLC